MVFPGRCIYARLAITQSMSRSIVAAIEQLSYANLQPLNGGGGGGVEGSLTVCGRQKPIYHLAKAKFSAVSLPPSLSPSLCLSKVLVNETASLPAIFAQRL